MEIEEIKQYLYNTVANKVRHEDYDRTVEVAEKSYAYSSGKGLNKYLHRFQQREDDALFKQREELTKHIVPAIINNLNFILNKIPRSNSLHLKFFNENTTSQEKLDEVQNIFYADKDVKNYFVEKNVVMDSTDPNAWLIVEHNSTDGSQLAQPYPFIVESEDAKNYEYLNGILQWLIVEIEENYTIYTKNQNVSLVVVNDEEIKSRLSEGVETIINDSVYIQLRNEAYEVIVFEPHNLEKVQAVRFGYNKDMQTYGNTYVPFWWDAEPYLSKIIKINSEFDIVMARHNFPQKITYAPRCNNEHCNRGQLITGGTCPTCKGTGFIAHTSAQDIIELSLPESKEEMIDLNNMISYIYPPVDGMEFTNTKIQELVEDCKKAVFNTDMFSRQEIAQTATSKVIDLQSIYDTIYPYAIDFASKWKFVIDTISRITDTNKGLTIIAYVDKDFKFKTKDELFNELTQAVNSGASESIIRAINDDLINIIYEDNQSELLKYKTKEYFNPFSGKSKEEVIQAMASSYVPKNIKVLQSNYGYIFDMLENENIDFYLMPRTKQKTLIDNKITELVNGLDTMPKLDLSFNTTQSTEEENIEQ